jgi:hypothetical protein
MQFKVHGKTVLIFEGSSTHWAVVWSVISVHFIMSFQVSLACETLLALRAMVRFHPTVQSHMLLHVRLYRKCFITFWTSVMFDWVTVLAVNIWLCYKTHPFLSTLLRFKVIFFNKPDTTVFGERIYFSLSMVLILAM